jgi:hypothetical protein
VPLVSPIPATLERIKATDNFGQLPTRKSPFPAALGIYSPSEISIRLRWDGARLSQKKISFGLIDLFTDTKPAKNVT